MDNQNPPFFGNGGGPRGFFQDGGHGGGTGALGWTIFALQLLMLVALAVLLVRAFAFRPARFAGGPGPRFMARRRGGGPHGPQDPLTHLRWRYARGEISRDEYLQAARDLGGGTETPTDEIPPA